MSFYKQTFLTLLISLVVFSYCIAFILSPIIFTITVRGLSSMPMLNGLINYSGDSKIFALHAIRATLGSPGFHDSAAYPVFVRIIKIEYKKSNNVCIIKDFVPVKTEVDLLGEYTATVVQYYYSKQEIKAVEINCKSPW